MEDKKYMTSGVTYSEEIAPGKSNWLRVDMLAFANAGSHELMIKVYTYDNDKQEVHFQGSLNELIELVLLGKLHKAQLQEAEKTNSEIAIIPKEAFANIESAKEHISHAKQELQAICDLCGKPTTGQNPHYDCAQKEAYLADGLRKE